MKGKSKDIIRLLLLVFVFISFFLHPDFTNGYVLPHLFSQLRVINVQCDRDFTT